MRDVYGPEISDLIVDYDPDTLARRPVRKADVLGRLSDARNVWGNFIARGLPTNDDGTLDERVVDGVLVRSHLELQRLHEEFRVGRTMKLLLSPMLDLVRASTKERPIRVVDLGCGLGYILRWLAADGALGDDIELVGADYNRALVEAASKLAAEDKLRCRFVAANAFRLAEPAHVYVSTGVLHHFRGQDLVRLFAEHEKSPALGFVHVDIRPSPIAPLGSFVFHVARMRESLAKFDGYWSAVRAHTASTLLGAIREGGPGFATATLDANPGIHTVVRIFQAVLGVRRTFASALPGAYASLASRLEIAS